MIFLISSSLPSSFDLPNAPFRLLFKGRFFDHEVAETLVNTRFPLLQNSNINKSS
jgi:hypothetical protein